MIIKDVEMSHKQPNLLKILNIQKFEAICPMTRL
jgi:hypothetical protein